MTWKNILKNKDSARDQYPRIMKLFMEETDQNKKQTYHEYMQKLEREMGVPESTIEQRELNRDSNWWKNAR
tara:strand:+ start:257 stop:469 length:213 start_codon:yes stop_codon:yes gene_type:complete